MLLPRITTNPYFIYAYNSSDTIKFRTYIIGQEVDMTTFPHPLINNKTNVAIYALQPSSNTTNIRSGYNTNTSMVINLRNFEIYNINQNGLCEVSSAKIGKGYIQSNEFIEK